MCYQSVLIFFFNDTATTEIYTLSLHDALPILTDRCCAIKRGSPLSEGKNYDQRLACGKILCLAGDRLMPRAGIVGTVEECVRFSDRVEQPAKTEDQSGRRALCVRGRSGRHDIDPGDLPTSALPGRTLYWRIYWTDLEGHPGGH